MQAYLFEIRDEPETARRQRIRQQRKRREFKIGFWCAFTAFCWGITPYAFVYADKVRGFDGMGGEIFVPLLPILLYAVLKMMKGVLKIILEVWASEYM